MEIINKYKRKRQAGKNRDQQEYHQLHISVATVKRN